MEQLAMIGKLPYGAWLIRAALCDLVDEKGGTLVSGDADALTRFTLPVYGNVSRFAIDLRDRPSIRPAEPDHCELTIRMTEPAAGLSKEGMRRAMHYVLDNITQRIENELQEKPVP